MKNEMKRIQNFQALRGVAFLLIFISHCFGNLKWWGASGVSLFIILSGFLEGMKYSNAKYPPLEDYVKRKIGKIYPLHLMQQVVEQLNQQPHIQNIYFFCGKGQETHIINKWCSKYNKCNNASQQLKSIEKELQLMAKLRLLITMDSANAHLAAIAGTEVITIWGATHPYAGFKAYNQKDENIIQAQLPCRPCSIYGNKPCQRQDYACLNNIQPQQIIDKIMHNINNNT